MKKALLITAATVLSLFVVTPAHAETVPGCPSAKQIGSTGYATWPTGQTMASVKQFAGCGQNFGYVWVWSDWAAQHPGFHASASVRTEDGVAHGKVQGRLNQREIWSKGTNTVDRCTRGMAWIALGEDGWQGLSSKRC
jgi:hypothetical protein